MFDSASGLYHFVLGSVADRFFLNSLESISFEEYIHRYLKKEGYEKIVFFINKNGQYHLSSFDDFSIYAFNYVKEYEQWRKSDEEFVTEMKNRVAGGQKPKGLNLVNTVPIKEKKLILTTDNSLKDCFDRYIVPNIQSKRKRTAIILDGNLLSITGIEDEAYKARYELANLMNALNNPCDGGLKNIIIWSFAEIANLLGILNDKDYQNVFGEIAAAIRNGSDNEAVLDELKKTNYLNDRIVEIGFPGADEMRNMLVRNYLQKNIELDFSQISDFATEMLKEMQETRWKKSSDDEVNHMIYTKNHPMFSLERRITQKNNFAEVETKINRELALSGDQVIKSMVGMDGLTEMIEDIRHAYQREISRRNDGNRAPSDHDALELDRFMGNGFNYTRINLNVAIVGNPGTGKTTVTRLLGRALKDMGILPIGHVVETSVGDLTEGYVGQTGVKFRKLIRESLGGVLFIDEAYQLDTQGGEHDSFNQEIRNILLKTLEDEKGKRAVVFAGYRGPTMRMIKSIEGLESRFRGKPIVLEDYDSVQLYEIFMKKIGADHYKLDPEIEALMPDIIHNWYAAFMQGEKEWANARTLLEEFYEPLISKVGADQVIKKESFPDAFLPYVKEYPQFSIEMIDTMFEGIIGQELVKNKIKRDLQSQIMKKMPTRVKNYLFYGNPGTGKTIIAKRLAMIYAASGMLKKGRVIIPTASELNKRTEAEQVRAIDEILEKSIDNVLVIDEIGILCRLAESALKSFITFIESEENKQRICVIFTGYQADYERLCEIEPGFERRINEKILFADYMVEELVEMTDWYMRKNLKDTDFEFAAGGIQEVRNFFEYRKKTRHFENADEAKKLADEICSSLSMAESSNLITEAIALDAIKARDYSFEPESKKASQKAAKIDPQAFIEEQSKIATIGYDQSRKHFFESTEQGLLYITVGGKGKEWHGSGFIISKNGLAITCNHVVEGGETIQARVRIRGRVGGDDTFHDAKVIWQDTGLDLAVIQLEGNNFTSLKIADNQREIHRGEEIAIIGYPFGEETKNDYTSFEGKIASLEQKRGGAKIFVLNSEAKCGNSGSPVISKTDGLVIGVLVGSITEESERLTEEINYMRPVSYIFERFLKPVISDEIKGE